ncbi:hypothetical protein [Bradyrhizobium sp. USDA 3364]
MTDRDEIIRRELFALIHDSATTKRDGGLVLTLDNINPALIEFVRGHDIYVVFWSEGGADHPLLIRQSTKDHGGLRGNAAFVKDYATALALRVACQSDDNVAPDVVSMEMTPEIEALLRAEGKLSAVVEWSE